MRNGRGEEVLLRMEGREGDAKSPESGFRDLKFSLAASFLVWSFYSGGTVWWGAESRFAAAPDVVVTSPTYAFR